MNRVPIKLYQVILVGHLIFLSLSFSSFKRERLHVLSRIIVLVSERICKMPAVVVGPERHTINGREK